MKKRIYSNTRDNWEKNSFHFRGLAARRRRREREDEEERQRMQHYRFRGKKNTSIYFKKNRIKKRKNRTDQVSNLKRMFPSLKSLLINDQNKTFSTKLKI